MPSYVFQGLVATVYPETRDVNGRPLGTVDPGDICMFDEAPDWLWVPEIPAGSSEQVAAEDAPAVASDPDPAPEPGPELAGPQPAPPAIVPPAGPAFAVTTDPQ